MEEREFDLDLGSGVRVTFLHLSAVVHPDAPNPAGIMIDHPNLANPSARCWGTAWWWRPSSDQPARPTWRLESKEPLHLEPSFLCTDCQIHGWIRGGRWVPA